MSKVEFTIGWVAWVDHMPQSSKSFHIRGSVMAKHPGHEALMKRCEPQGINPKELLMELELKELPGNWPQVVTNIPVVYEEEHYNGDHATVKVINHDIRIEVQIVQ